MKLLTVQGSAQEVAEAISAVLGVDVTIADKDLIRVASTGIYKNFVGERLPENCSFDTIFKNKKPEFIDKPNISEKCINCSSKGSCYELATIGYPIISENKLLGVIGLIAFTEEQRKMIEDKFDSLIVFLGKLGDLLAGNLIYTETIKALQIQDEETKEIINGIRSGIICTDINGDIKFINNIVEEYLGFNKEEIIGKPLKNFIKEFDANKDFKEMTELKIKTKTGNRSFIIEYTPVVVENEIVSSIIEIQKTSSMIKNVYKIIGNEKIIDFDDIIGNSKEIKNVKTLAKNISKSKSSVLLRGDSGTGKELFARSIHNESDRYNNPFVAINCASIPDNLLESELFGYEGGSFTGAKKEGHMGKFELAKSGTLFLDEIGDLPIHLQPKLLRVLQDEGFMRIGGEEIIPVDFRLVTATNRNLEQMIIDGEFREDLYYRLNVIPINIPALKDRYEDIEILVNSFLEEYCKILDKNKKTISEEGFIALKNYNWPGNIRELKNIIEYLVNIVPEDKIEYKDLPNNIKNYNKNNNIELNNNLYLKDILDNFEKDLLNKYLDEYGRTTEDKEKISEVLNINLSTLYRKLNKYDLQ